MTEASCVLVTADPQFAGHDESAHNFNCRDVDGIPCGGCINCLEAQELHRQDLTKKANAVEQIQEDGYGCGDSMTWHADPEKVPEECLWMEEAHEHYEDGTCPEAADY